MRALATGAVLLAAVQTASPSGCTPAAQACGLSFQGISVRAGEVWDVVTVTCDPPPTEHYVQVWLEYKPFDRYDSYGRHAATRKIPDRTGFQLTVHSPCFRGWYRTQAQVDGRGPSTAQHPDGIAFNFEDTGRARYLTAEQCSEGG